MFETGGGAAAQTTGSAPALLRNLSPSVRLMIGAGIAGGCTAAFCISSRRWRMGETVAAFSSKRQWFGGFSTSAEPSSLS